MSVIDLSDISGLPVTFDDESCKLCSGVNLQYKQEMEVGLNEITPILLNKSLKYPENVGYIYKEIACLENGNVQYSEGHKHSYDIYVIPSGLLGIEFNKTHVFYCSGSKNKYAGLMEVLSGEVTVIMQKNKKADVNYSLNTLVEEIDILNLQKGEKIGIPSGVMFSFVNTGNKQSIFSFVGSTHTTRVDYNKLKKEKGLAYYIISKNAKAEIVANPKYKVQNPPKNLTIHKLSDSSKKQFQIDFLNTGMPLYKMVMAEESLIESILA